jgi:predicted kinase
MPFNCSAPPVPGLLRELVAPGIRLVLIRGLPGSGKSTLARRLAAELGYVHLEADQYFKREGPYRFDIARLADAHAWCQRQAYEHLAAGASVVMANTFVTLWELSPALGLAELLALPYRIVEARGAWPNVHAVPEDVLAQMRMRWEPLPEHLAPLARTWGAQA